MRRFLTQLAPTIAALAVLIAGPTVPAQATGAPRWRITSVLQHCGHADSLSAITASGPGDAWALGQPSNGGHSCWADVEHWNGTRWQRVPVPPGPGAVRSFFSPPRLPLAASSARNAWIFPTRVSRSLTFYNEALHWNGQTWRASQFPAQLIASSAVTFGQAAAWAFGEVYTRENVAAPYTARWNGHAWHQASPPGQVLAVSALSSRDMWAAGPTLATAARPLARQHLIAMHWTGQAWHVLPLPALTAPSHASLASAQLTAIGPRDVWWCYQASTQQANGPVNLARWDGVIWQRVAVPAGLASVDAITQDGHGGLWLLADASSGPEGLNYRQYWYHCQAGQWTRQLVPSPLGTGNVLFAMAWVPGTRKAWAAGEADYDRRNASEGVITRYRP